MLGGAVQPRPVRHTALGLNNEISGNLGTTLLWLGWGGLMGWYGVRLNEWRRARKADDGSEESRSYIQSLRSSANRSFLWTIGGMAAVWVVLDLVF